MEDMVWMHTLIYNTSYIIVINFFRNHIVKERVFPNSIIRIDDKVIPVIGFITIR